MIVVTILAVSLHDSSYSPYHGMIVVTILVLSRHDSSDLLYHRDGIIVVTILGWSRHDSSSDYSIEMFTQMKLCLNTAIHNCMPLKSTATHIV